MNSKDWNRIGAGNFDGMPQTDSASGLPEPDTCGIEPLSPREGNETKKNSEAIASAFLYAKPINFEVLLRPPEQSIDENHLRKFLLAVRDVGGVSFPSKCPCCEKEITFRLTYDSKSGFTIEMKPHVTEGKSES